MPGRQAVPVRLPVLAAAWYAGLTAAVLGFAYRDRGIGRMTGILVIVAYVVFAGSVAGLAYAGPQATGVVTLAGLAVAAVCAAWLVRGRHRDPGHSEPGPSLPGPAGRAQESLLAGWPVNRLWVLGVAASLTVAVNDAALGNRAVLIGLLIVGPCCVILTGRWVPTALTGVWVAGLAVALGFPDGIWGTAIFFIWLGAVGAVALASTGAAAFIQAFGRVHPR